VFDFSAPRKRTNVVGGSGTGTVADVEHHPLGVSACIAMLSRFVARKEKRGNISLETLHKRHTHTKLKKKRPTDQDKLTHAP
jgi:hypothetical protein